VGKKCKRALQALPDTQAAQAVDTVLDDVGDQATGGVEDHVSSLVSVISQLVTRLDSQQEQPIRSALIIYYACLYITIYI
jgi:hypothetical protein